MTKDTTSIEKKWWIKGLIFENCNYQIISHGHISYRQLCNHERCVGHWAIHIDKGQFHEVALNDLNIIILSAFSWRNGERAALAL